MVDFGALTAVGTTSLLATERANARRVQGELNELREVQRRDSQTEKKPTEESIRQTNDARRSVVASFTANRAFTAKLAEQSMGEGASSKVDIDAGAEESKPSAEAKDLAGVISKKEAREASDKAQSNPYDLFRTESYSGFESSLSAVA